MQEPSIFNYNIMDNVLYGKLNATNSEILNATTIANCNEFIEKGQLDALDETPTGLISEMVNNKLELVRLMGQEKYDSDLDVLKKLEELEVKKGTFLAMDGDVDTREASLKDV